MQKESPTAREMGKMRWRNVNAEARFPSGLKLRLLAAKQNGLDAYAFGYRLGASHLDKKILNKAIRVLLIRKRNLLNGGQLLRNWESMTLDALRSAFDRYPLDCAKAAAWDSRKPSESMRAIFAEDPAIFVLLPLSRRHIFLTGLRAGVLAEGLRYRKSRLKLEN